MRKLSALFVCVVILMVASACAQKSEPADHFMMPGVSLTRINKSLAKQINEQDREQSPIWLTLTLGSQLYVDAGAALCQTLPELVARSKASENERDKGDCLILAHETTAVAKSTFHLKEDDYAILITLDSGETRYVAGGYVKPIIPNGTPFAIATDDPDCGHADDSDSPPCGTEFVDASGEPVCKPYGDERAVVLESELADEHNVRVKILDGPTCAGKTGYMNEMDVAPDSVLGFADIAGATESPVLETTAPSP